MIISKYNQVVRLCACDILSELHYLVFNCINSHTSGI